MRFTLLSLLFFVCCSCFAQVDEQLAEAYYNKAESAFTANDYENTVKYLDRAQTSLGKTNTTILYLAIKAEDAMIKNNFTPELLKKEKNSLDKFFAIVDKPNYPTDKYSEIIAIKIDFDDLMEKKGATIVKTEDPPVSQTTPAPPPATTPAPDASKQSPPDDSIILGDLHIYSKEFEQKVNQQMKDFRIYCENIAMGKANYLKSIDICIKNVFENNESRKVQVTSRTSSDPVSYTIRRYLGNMARYHYTDVKITHKDIEFISQLHKGDDGKYYGHVSYVQDFTAWRENRVIISDQVRKDQEIVVETFEDMTDGGKMTRGYKVFLGNLTVINKIEKQN